MSVEKFVEKLQENDVDEAISSIKTVLKEKLESVLEEKRKVILEGLGFVISEKEEMDDEEDDDEMDDDEGEEKEEKDD